MSGGLLDVGLMLFGLAASAAGTILWFLYRSVRADARQATDKAEAVKQSLGEYKLYVAEHYVTQTALSDKISGLQGSIERLIESVDRNAQETRNTISQLYEKIDRKADK